MTGTPAKTHIAPVEAEVGTQTIPYMAPVEALAGILAIPHWAPMEAVAGTPAIPHMALVDVVAGRLSTPHMEGKGPSVFHEQGSPQHRDSFWNKKLYEIHKINATFRKKQALSTKKEANDKRVALGA